MKSIAQDWNFWYSAKHGFRDYESTLSCSFSLNWRVPGFNSSSFYSKLFVINFLMSMTLKIKVSYIVTITVLSIFNAKNLCFRIG